MPGRASRAGCKLRSSLKVICDAHGVEGRCNTIILDGFKGTKISSRVKTQGHLQLLTGVSPLKQRYRSTAVDDPEKMEIRVQ